MASTGVVGRPVALPTGVFCISIDLELLWGVWDTLDSAGVDACNRFERPAVRGILDLLDQYEVPVTWAFVGRLLDDSRGFDGLRGDPSNWFAPDLIDQIRSRDVDHEIATHTFSHIYFGQADRTSVLNDLLMARHVHEQHGLPFQSLVFPRNQVGHLDVLAEAGIETYRSVDAGFLQRCQTVAPRLRPIANLVDKALPTCPPVVLPIVHEDGLVELPSSMLLIGRNGLRRTASVASMRTKLRRGIESAVERNAMFHLWFHPSNFYSRQDEQLTLLDSALATAARYRDLAQIEILPMCAVGERARERMNVSPSLG
jgi:Polysaccharide deacetylase